MTCGPSITVCLKCLLKLWNISDALTLDNRALSLSCIVYVAENLPEPCLHDLAHHLHCANWKAFVHVVS